MHRFISLLGIIITFTSFLSCNNNKKENCINTPTTVDSTHAPQYLTMLFVGDIMQHDLQISTAKCDSGYNYDSYWKYIGKQIAKADLAIGNFETTLGEEPYKGFPLFSAPDDFAQSLHQAGFDILLTCNNHSMDRGTKGVKRTIKRIQEMGMTPVGTYLNNEDRDKRYPLIVERNGIKVALLNYTYGINGFTAIPPQIVNLIDTTLIKQDILKARQASPDVIIACMHWGAEYIHQPGAETRQLADWLIDNGVDHIIGNHPHVVQPLEIRQDTILNKKNLVVYSLGNFTSNFTRRATDGGMIVKLTLVKDSTTRIDNCGYSLVYNVRPIQSGKDNYEIISATNPPEDYPYALRQAIQTFVNDAHNILRETNVTEYSF